jgi:hypothetical protein
VGEKQSVLVSTADDRVILQSQTTLAKVKREGVDGYVLLQKPKKGDVWQGDPEERTVTRGFNFASPTFAVDCRAMLGRMIKEFHAFDHGAEIIQPFTVTERAFAQAGLIVRI